MSEFQKQIAWIVPYVSAGSGGIQTICRHLSYLQSKGAKCHVLVFQDSTALSESQIRETLAQAYGCYPDAVSPKPFSDVHFDIAIATFNMTVPYLQFLDSEYRCYFVQDFEPWFYPMGEGFLAARNTYSLGVPIITVGRWLAYKIANEFGARVWHTDFAVDKSLYRLLDMKRVQAVCAVFQPEKPRRCGELLCRALEVLNDLRPDIEIFTYGSEIEPQTDAPIMHLGVLSKSECNELYNYCKAGICISLSNPSRIPFEMMAAGLPVVDIYQENTLLDYPKSVALARVDPPAIASAALELLDDDDKWHDASRSGLHFVAHTSAMSESESFSSAIAQIMHGGLGESIENPASLDMRNETKAHEDALSSYRHIYRRRLVDIVTRPIPEPESEPISEPEYESRYLIVQISRPERVSRIEEARLYVWADPDQSDMIRYSLQVNAGTMAAQIDFADFGFVDGRYNIHAYAMLDGVDTQLSEGFAQTCFKVDDSTRQEGDQVKAVEEERAQLLPMLLEESNDPLAVD